MRPFFVVAAFAAVIAMQAGQRISYSPKLRIYKDGDYWEYEGTTDSEIVGERASRRRSTSRSRTTLKLVKADEDYNWFEATAASTGMSMRNMSALVPTTVSTFKQHKTSGNVFFVTERHLLPDFQTSPAKPGGLIYPGGLTNESVIEGSTSFSGPRAKGQTWTYIEDTKVITNHGDLYVKVFGHDIVRRGVTVFSGRTYIHPALGNAMVYIHEWTGSDSGMISKTIYMLDKTNVSFPKPD